MICVFRVFLHFFFVAAICLKMLTIVENRDDVSMYKIILCKGIVEIYCENACFLSTVFHEKNLQIY